VQTTLPMLRALIDYAPVADASYGTADARTICRDAERCGSERRRTNGRRHAAAGA